jgi:hypothetical protein
VPQGKYTNREDMAEAMMVQATEAFRTVEKLAVAYERASRNPTRENVENYRKAIYEVVNAEDGETASVISVMVATVFSLIGNNGPKR